MSVGIKLTPKNPSFQEYTRTYYPGERTILDHDEFRGTMSIEDVNSIFPKSGNSCLRLFFAPGHVAIEPRFISYVEANGSVLRSGDSHVVQFGRVSTLRLHDVVFEAEVFHFDD